jgi:thioredoxin-like negative regulator of GroEL
MQVMHACVYFTFTLLCTTMVLTHETCYCTLLLQVPPVLMPQDGSTVTNSSTSNDNTQQARAQEVMINARASLHLNMATVHLLDNDLVQAEKCLQSALRIAPTSPAALKTLVYVLLKKGNTVEALNVLRTGRHSAAAVSNGVSNGTRN